MQLHALHWKHVIDPVPPHTKDCGKNSQPLVRAMFSSTPMAEGKLDVDQKGLLAAQLSMLDLTRIAKPHEEAMEFDGKGQSDLGQLQPLDTYASIADASEQQEKTWGDLGFAAIAKGEVAALVLAGGAGPRPGFALPKGLCGVELPSDKPLFQLFAGP
jgi:UDP-N-acetylglucosamine/UDP-N-acetylgalactosamine diphosphorylase